MSSDVLKGPYVGGFISISWSSLSALFGLPLALVVYGVIEKRYIECSMYTIRKLYLHDRILFRICYFIVVYFFCPIGPYAFALHHGLMIILVNIGLFLKPLLAPSISVEVTDMLANLVPFTSLFV